MAVYDITMTLWPGMPTYPGEPGPEIDYLKRIGPGTSANVSQVSMGSHCGTHVDAPHHFIDGRPTVEELPLEALLGPAFVVEHPGEDHITASDLDRFAIPAYTRRLLVKTQNSRFADDEEFHTDFVAFAPDAGAWLVGRGFVLVGIDYLSIEQFHSPTHEVHLALLRAGIVVLEGLDLRGVIPGRYNMACAPLKMAGAEGAPARVFLWDELPA